MNTTNARVAIYVSAVLVSAGCSNSASDALGKGKASLDRGELSAAVIEFKNAVQANASSMEARVALGDALERTGDLNGAEQNYRRALELGGNADDLVPRIAILLLDRGDMPTIVRDFADKQLALPSADSELRGIVALAQLSLGRRDAAQAQLAKAESTSPAIRLARAQMAVQANHAEQALAELEGALREGKAPWWVLRAASRVYAASGDQTKALAAMKGAYDQAGSHQSVVGEYAEQLFHAGRSDEAKPLLEKLRKIAPRYYRTAYLEALFYAKEGKFDEAHDAASKVLAKMPGHAPSLLLAAQIELDKGELASAATRVERLLSKNPSSLPSLRLKLAVDLRGGDTKSAATTLEQALRVAPNDREVLAASADLAWARGDKAGAIKQMSAAALTRPPQAELFARLAEMKFALGKRDEASQAAGQAVALTKDDAGLRAKVFRSVVSMNMLDKAKEMAMAEIERRPKEPEPLLWQAVVLGMQGNEKTALEQTGKALDMQADYYPALMALGRAATTTEHAKEYETRLQRAIDAGTKNPRIFLDFARKLVIAGADAEKVGAVLAKGIAADPASVSMRRAAVNHWLTWNRQDKAMAVAADGEAAQPDNVALKELAAATQEATGNFEQAAAKYAELEARFPDRAEWGLSRARALLGARKATDAMLALRKITSEHPEEPAAYRMLAMVQVDQKQVPDALLTADMLANKPKLRAVGLLLRGDVHARAQDKGEAIKAYDDAAKAGAAEEAMIRRVELQDRTGGEAFAAGELNDWLKSHPNSIPALTLAARRATGKQDYPTAARHLESIVKLDPRNAVALNDLAWTYVLARNPAALPTAQRAAALLPGHPQVLDTLAGAQALAGKKVEAVANLRLALSAAPGNPVVRIHLAELLAEQGDKKEAVALVSGLEKVSLDKESAGRLRDLKARL